MVLRLWSSRVSSHCCFADVHSMPTSQNGSSGVEEARAVPATAVQEYALTVGARVFVTSARRGFGIQVSSFDMQNHIFAGSSRNEYDDIMISH